MKFLSRIEFRNLLLDVVITLLAFQYFNITEFVENSLHWAIYFIVIIQSFALFLLWGEESFDEEFVADIDRSFIEKIKINFKGILTGFMMFSWVLGVFWVLIPIEYVEQQTNQEYVWAIRLSVFVCVVNGLILLVRLFANLSDVEIRKIERWRRQPDVKKKRAEKILISIYSFFIYGNVGNKTIRYWLAYLTIFAFLVYSETLFEILYREAPVSRVLIFLAILFSYFPMRLLLLIKPPISFVEVLSAFTAFGIFLYMLFVR